MLVTYNNYYSISTVFRVLLFSILTFAYEECSEDEKKYITASTLVFTFSFDNMRVFLVQNDRENGSMSSHFFFWLAYFSHLCFFLCLTSFGLLLSVFIFLYVRVHLIQCSLPRNLPYFLLLNFCCCTAEMFLFP